ncbi:putative ribosomal N-acetyltransferase YdaF [compost metagenome]
MTEALKPIIQYGFETMKLNRIEAFLSPDNIPSLKLVQKFGFTKEGHLREHYNKDNKLEDSAVYSLLKSEYKAID